MAKTIEFEGNQYQFPDDATDAEISNALGGSTSTQAPATPPTKAPEAPQETIYPVNTPTEGYNKQPAVEPPTTPPKPADNSYAGQYAQAQQGVRNSLGGTEATTLPTGHQVAEHWRGMGAGAKYTLQRQASTVTDLAMDIAASSIESLSSDGNSAYANSLRNVQNTARDRIDLNEQYKAQQLAKSPERAKGFEVGQTGVNVGESLIPTAGIPLMATTAAGETFEQTGSKASAALDFAKNMAAGYAAVKVGGMAGKGVQKAIGVTGKAGTATRAAVGATTGVTGAIAGGGTAGAVNAALSGGDVAEGFKEGAFNPQNLLIGAALGAKGGAKKAPTEATKYSNEDKALVTSQHQDYSTATNSTQKSAVLDKSANLQAHNDIQTMKDFDIPIHGSSFKGDEAGAKMAGVKPTNKPLSATELNTKVKDESGKKVTLGEKIATNYKSYRDSALSNINNVSRQVNSLKAGISEQTGKANVGETNAVNQATNKSLTNYNSKLKDLHATMKDANSTPEQIKAAAVEADTAYSKLPDTAKQSIHEMTGEKAIDHVADAHNFVSVSNRVESALPGKKYTPPKGEISLHGAVEAVKHPLSTAVKTLGRVGYAQAKQSGVREQLNASATSAKMNENLTAGKGGATYAQRKQLQSMNHPEATNKALTQQEAQNIIQGRNVKAAPEQVPGQEQTPLERGVASQMAKSRNEALNKYKDQINDPELKERLKVEDLRNPAEFKEKLAAIKREDNSRNVEKIRKQNEIKATASQTTANVKHEAATKELTRWASEEGKFIPQEYIDQARKQATKITPEGERILDASRVKAIAMKNFESKAGAGTAIKGTKSEFYHAITHDLPAEVRDSVKAHVDKAYGNNKQLSGESLKSLWSDVYTMGAEHHAAKGENTQAKNLTKLANRNVDTINAREMSVQHEALTKEMKAAFKDAHNKLGDEAVKMTPEEQQDFIDHHLSSVFEGRNKSMNRTELNTQIQRVRELAGKQAKSWSDKTVAEQAKDLGASEEHVKELEANQPGKMNASDSKSVLIDIGNNYTDALRNGDIAKFRKTLAANKGLAHHLDKAGGNVAAFNRFETVAENVADRLEAMPKGSDKRALVSKEEFNSIVHNNVGYKDRLLDLAGVKDPKELLSESDRSKLETDITSGKHAQRESTAQKVSKANALRERLNKSALTARQQQPRVIRPKA